VTIIHGDADKGQIYGHAGKGQIYGDAGKGRIYGDAGKGKIYGHSVRVNTFEMLAVGSQHVCWLQASRRGNQ
jgi:hypothetical protein